MQRSIVGGLTASAALATAVNAQDAPVQLPPIILDTAFRDNRNILDAPVAASVIEAESLDQRQAETYEELIGDIPGVVIEGGPRGISQEPNIRGFQDEQVVLRIDGGRLNFNQAHRGRFFLDPDIVQRVEVVRGGGSTLFGSGAIGGVIAIETRDAADLLRPDQTVGGRVRLGYSDNGQVFSPSLTAFGDWGNFDALAFIGTRQYGEALEDGDGNDILRSEVDSTNAIVKFGFEPTPDQRIELNLGYYEDEGITPGATDSVATATNEADRSADIRTGRLSWDWNPDNSDVVDLSVLLYGNTLEIEEDRLFDGRTDQTEYDTVGFEVVNRSRFDVGVPVDLVYGLEAFRDTQTGTRDGDDRLQFPDAEAETIGVFTEATFAVTDQLDIIAGARFDNYQRDPNDSALEDIDESFFSPRIGISYRPNVNWQVYGNVARAFRAPTLTELYNDGEHFSVEISPFLRGVNNFTPTPNLEEEESTQYEIGTRFERGGVSRPGDVLRFSANAYYADVDNFIDTVVTPFDFSTARTGFVFGETFQRNVDARLWGFEAEVEYDAGPWFASLALTLPEGEQTGGDALGAIPQDRVTATFGYRPIEDVTVGIRATYAGDQDDVPENSVEGDSYTVVDLFANWAPDSGPLEGAVLRAGVDNLFDEDYTIFPNELPQPGRTFRVSVTYSF